MELIKKLGAYYVPIVVKLLKFSKWMLCHEGVWWAKYYHMWLGGLVIILAKTNLLQMPFVELYHVYI